MSNSVRVAVVDDHPLVRAGIVMSLGDTPHFEVVGQGESATDAVRIAHETRPDVLLLDVCMPGSGIEAAREVVPALPGTKVVLLTASVRAEHLSEALCARVHGYILKGLCAAELADAVLAVAHGEDRFPVAGVGRPTRPT